MKLGGSPVSKYQITGIGKFMELMNYPTSHKAVRGQRRLINHNVGLLLSQYPDHILNRRLAEIVGPRFHDQPVHTDRTGFPAVFSRTPLKATTAAISSFAVPS